MPTYVDDNGRLDPDGNWQVVNGRTTLRPGRMARFNVMALDSAAPPAVSDAAITVSVERERYLHDLHNGKLGDQAPEFSSEQAVPACRDALDANDIAAARQAMIDDLTGRRAR